VCLCVCLIVVLCASLDTHTHTHTHQSHRHRHVSPAHITQKLSDGCCFHSMAEETQNTHTHTHTHTTHTHTHTQHSTGGPHTVPMLCLRGRPPLEFRGMLPFHSPPLTPNLHCHCP